MSAAIVKALRAMGEGHKALAKDGALVLTSPGGRTKVRADAATVGRMISDGLLVRVRDTVTRSDAGRMFLRRALSGGVDDVYQAQHRDVVAPSQPLQEAGAVQLNAAESPLAWLSTRRDKSGAPMITPEQSLAGHRLFADYERGHQRARTTQAWDASCVRGSTRRDGMTVSEAASDARRRVEKALAAVGPGLCDVLVGVCCDQLGLEAVEKQNRWPARSAKVILRLALDRLAAHYGIAAEAKGNASGPLVHWGTQDYRPRA
ncbi:MAG: DUF6456 domain-containing protein [Pseudomonadota bacterium]